MGHRIFDSTDSFSNAKSFSNENTVNFSCEMRNGSAVIFAWNYFFRKKKTANIASKM